MRTLLFRLAALTIVVATIELASLAALSLATGELASPNQVSAQRRNLGQSDRTASFVNTRMEVLHPYLGFVLDPGLNNPGRTRFRKGQPISSWGFLDSAPPLRKRAEDRVIIGIFGGSVAYWFSVEGIEAMISALEKAGTFAGREISVVRVALGGYKQPQQLLALAYLLTAGAEFDLIINLDGFNEVALPAAENIVQGVSPLYPRNWRRRAESTPSHRELTVMGTITLQRTQRQRYAAIADTPPLRWSSTSNLLWWAVDQRLARRLSKLHLELMAHGPEDDDGFTTLGPEQTYTSSEAMYAALADTWRRASLQMHHLAASNGARYWHFLQPNQYVPDSKPMGDTERQLALGSESPFGQHIALGYPHLQASGRALVAAGVEFYDLTQLFADESTAVYSDDCCHFNSHGNALLGAALGRQIAGGASRPISDAP